MQTAFGPYEGSGTVTVAVATAPSPASNRMAIQPFGYRPYCTAIARTLL